MTGPAFADAPSVSGRNTPHQAPLPDRFRHDVRFHASVNGKGISAFCHPCRWGIWVDDGHNITDLIRLVCMHAGEADVTILTVETLLEILKPAVTP